MFQIPNLTHTGTSKITPKLTIAYVSQHTIQFASPKAPVRARYVSAPYGMSRAEMDHTRGDCLTLSLEITDAEQLRFWERVEERVSRECSLAFKRNSRPLLREGLLKVKVPLTTAVVDTDMRAVSIDEVRSGAVVVPILRVSSLWCGGGECGAALKAMKLMLVEQAAPREEEDVAFAF